MFGGSPWSNPSVGSHRHSNLSLAPTSPPHERRPLRSVPTVGSHFKVDPEVLARDYVEKETKVSRDIYIRNETIFYDIALKFF